MVAEATDDAQWQRMRGGANGVLEGEGDADRCLGGGGAVNKSASLGYSREEATLAGCWMVEVTPVGA